MKKHLMTAILVLFMMQQVSAQNPKEISLQKAIGLAQMNNPRMKAASSKIEQEQVLKKTAFNFNNLDIVFEAPTGDELRPGVMQFFEFPTVYLKQYQNQCALVRLAEAEKEMTANMLAFNVKISYNDLQFYIQKEIVLHHYDSIFAKHISLNNTQHKVGQINSQERMNGESKYHLIINQKMINEAEQDGEYYQLSNLVYGRPDSILVQPEGVLTKVTTAVTDEISNASYSSNPVLAYYAQYRNYATKSLSLQRNRFLPGFFLGYLNQGTRNTDLGYRIRLGVSIPVWFWKYTAQIKAAKLGIEIVQTQAEMNRNTISSEYVKTIAMLNQYKKILDYYDKNGLSLTKEIVRSSTESFKIGSIDYYTLLTNLEQSFQLEINYLDAIRNYNQAAYKLEYIKGIN